jgi:hypothetical protein
MIKGIVSRTFAMLLLIPLESQKYSEPFLLYPFLKISWFSCRIFDYNIFGINEFTTVGMEDSLSTPTCTLLKMITSVYECVNLAPGANHSTNQVTHLGLVRFDIMGIKNISRRMQSCWVSKDLSF